MRRGGRTALITGGARRIGRACALALAREGYDLVIHYRRSHAAAKSLAREAETLGARVWLVRGDLSRPAEAARVFDRAVSCAGPIGLLLNNASTYEESALADVRAEEIVRNLNLHALSPLVLGRRFAAQRKKGMILNFLDARMVRHDSRHAAYQMSKRLLHELTKMMAVEFAPRVRVNAVAPGAILPPPGASAAYVRRLERANPLQRMGTPEEVARAVVYLAGTEFVTGQAIFVDGGYHLKGDFHG